MAFSELINTIKENNSLFISIFVVILLIVLINFISRFVRRKLLKKAKSKKQISNIKVFVRMLSIIFVILIVMSAFFSYIGSWTSLGIIAGLLTAALGFALQRPITGIAAWIMVVLKRPFIVGDRIIIGNIKGEVYDISLTHIYIDEIGGEIESDEWSGRNIMVPNYMLFEHNIINYTLTHDYVLGEVIVDITYESNLDNAINIVKESAMKFAKEHTEAVHKEVNVKIKMVASCMAVKVRFYAPVKIMQQISSSITKEIYDQIKKSKDVEISYPHVQIVKKGKT